MTSGEEGSSNWQLKLEKVLKRMKRMVKDSTASVQKQCSRKELFSLEMR